VVQFVKSLGRGLKLRKSGIITTIIIMECNDVVQLGGRKDAALQGVFLYYYIIMINRI